MSDGEQGGEAPPVEPVTDGEYERVFELNNRSIELLAYLNSDDCATFTVDQLNAFYSLGMAFGFAETRRRFHPDVLDPTSQVMVDTIRNAGLIFPRPQANAPPPDPPQPPPRVDTPPPRARPRSTSPPRASGSRRSDGFGTPGASSTRIPDGSILIPQTELQKILDRLDAQDARERVRMSNTLLPSHDESDELTAAPKLGSGGNIANSLKAIKAVVGAKKFSLDDAKLYGSPFRSLLPMVANIITEHRLNETNAYVCFLSTLEGELHTLLGNEMRDKKPFAASWRYIQMTAQGVYSRESIEKEIKKLFNSAPTSASHVFSRLRILCRNLYQHIPDLDERNSITNNRICDGINHLLQAFYPSCQTVIEGLMEEQRRNAPPHYDKVTTLIETAVNYINKRSVALGPDNLKMTALTLQTLPHEMVPSQPPSHAVQHGGSGFHQSQVSQQGPEKQYEQQRPRNDNRYRDQQQQGQQRGPGKGNCYKCNKPGHWAAACRTYAAQSIKRVCNYCAGLHAEVCVFYPKNGQQGQQGSQVSGGNRSSQSTPATGANKTPIGKGSHQGSASIGHEQALPESAFMNSMNVSGVN